LLTQDALRHGSAPANSTQGAPSPYLAPFSRPGVAIGLGLATLALLVIFNRFPQLDLAVASWFFTEQPCPEDDPGPVCGSFTAMNNTTLMLIREVLHYLPVSLAIPLLIAAIPAGLSSVRRYRLFARGAMTAVAAILISPLLIVNGLLKEFSGRPRPVHTDVFGGDWPFVEAGRFTDYCSSNCSFAWVVALSLAVTTSGLRIAFGGHYLSDVLLGAAITIFVFSALAAFARWRRWYEV
jgi:lipid A 4'-phosphatase